VPCNTQLITTKATFITGTRKSLYILLTPFCVPFHNGNFQPMFSLIQPYGMSYKNWQSPFLQAINSFCSQRSEAVNTCATRSCRPAACFVTRSGNTNACLYSTDGALTVCQCLKTLNSTASYCAHISTPRSVTRDFLHCLWQMQEQRYLNPSSEITHSWS
jgi:hypothetical protein